MLVSRFIMDLRDIRPMVFSSVSTLSKGGGQHATSSGMSSLVLELGQDLSHAFPLDDEEDALYADSLEDRVRPS